MNGELTAAVAIGAIIGTVVTLAILNLPDPIIACAVFTIYIFGVAFVAYASVGGHIDHDIIRGGPCTRVNEPQHMGMSLFAVA